MGTYSKRRDRDSEGWVCVYKTDATEKLFLCAYGTFAKALKVCGCACRKDYGAIYKLQKNMHEYDIVLLTSEVPLVDVGAVAPPVCEEPPPITWATGLVMVSRIPPPPELVLEVELVELEAGLVTAPTP